MDADAVCLARAVEVSHLNRLCEMNDQMTRSDENAVVERERESRWQWVVLACLLLRMRKKENGGRGNSTGRQR